MAEARKRRGLTEPEENHVILSSLIELSRLKLALFVCFELCFVSFKNGREWPQRAKISEVPLSLSFISYSGWKALSSPDTSACTVERHHKVLFVWRSWVIRGSNLGWFKQQRNVLKACQEVTGWLQSPGNQGWSPRLLNARTTAEPRPLWTQGPTWARLPLPSLSGPTPSAPGRNSQHHSFKLKGLGW